MSDAQKTDDELDKVYNFLGHYIILFQAIEHNLDESIRSLIGVDDYIFKPVISKLSNSEKIALLKNIILSGDSHMPSDEGWMNSFKETMKACIDEAEIRNQFVHSTYLFDFVARGYPVQFTKAKSDRNIIRDDTYSLDEVDMRAHIDRATELLFAVYRIKEKILEFLPTRGKTKLSRSSEDMSLTDILMAVNIQSIKDKFWEQAASISGKDPKTWRQDAGGRVMRYGSYGTRGKYGWEVSPAPTLSSL